MKVTRSYTLDEEVIKKLSEVENASALINKLLIEHFRVSVKKTLAELEKELKILEIKKEAEIKMQEIENAIE